MYSLIHLPNQEPDEKGELLLRRHWFTLLVQFLIYLILFLTPILFFSFMWNTFLSEEASSTIYAFTIMLISAYYLAIMVFMFQEFLDFYLDVWVITTERVIAIEQKGLFARELSEQKLFRVQDVTAEVKGIFPTLLNYGNVYVQTAGEQIRFIFKNVPNAPGVAQLINDSVNTCRVAHHHGNGAEDV